MPDNALRELRSCSFRCSAWQSVFAWRCCVCLARPVGKWQRRQTWALPAVKYSFVPLHNAKAELPGAALCGQLSLTLSSFCWAGCQHVSAHIAPHVPVHTRGVLSSLSSQHNVTVDDIREPTPVTHVSCVCLSPPLHLVVLSPHAAGHGVRDLSKVWHESGMYM